MDYEKQIKGEAIQGGMKAYGLSVKGDGDRNIYNVVDLLIQSPTLKLGMKTIVEEVAPEEAEHFDVAFLGSIEGMHKAAVEAGHTKNAEYISNALERAQNQ